VSEKDETYARIVQVGIVYRGCMSSDINEFVFAHFTFLVQVG
jgi:hypothetical protein